MNLLMVFLWLTKPSNEIKHFSGVLFLFYVLCLLFDIKISIGSAWLVYQHFSNVMVFLPAELGVAGGGSLWPGPWWVEQLELAFTSYSLICTSLSQKNRRTNVPSKTNMKSWPWPKKAGDSNWDEALEQEPVYQCLYTRFQWFKTRPASEFRTMQPFLKHAWMFCDAFNHVVRVYLPAAPPFITFNPSNFCWTPHSPDQGHGTSGVYPSRGKWQKNTLDGSPVHHRSGLSHTHHALIDEHAFVWEETRKPGANHRDTRRRGKLHSQFKFSVKCRFSWDYLLLGLACLVYDVICVVRFKCFFGTSTDGFVITTLFNG